MAQRRRRRHRPQHHDADVRRLGLYLHGRHQRPQYGHLEEHQTVQNRRRGSQGPFHTLRTRQARLRQSGADHQRHRGQSRHQGRFLQGARRTAGAGRLHRKGSLSVPRRRAAGVLQSGTILLSHPRQPQALVAGKQGRAAALHAQNQRIGRGWKCQRLSFHPFRHKGDTLGHRHPGRVEGLLRQRQEAVHQGVQLDSGGDAANERQPHRSRTALHPSERHQPATALGRRHPGERHFLPPVRRAGHTCLARILDDRRHPSSAGQGNVFRKRRVLHKGHTQPPFTRLLRGFQREFRSQRNARTG